MDTTCLPISSSDSFNEDGIDGAIEGLGKLDIGAGGSTCDFDPEIEDDPEDDLEDEAEDDSDNDTSPPFTTFEASHPWLFKLLRRSCPIFTGPEAAMDRLNTVKPARFYRVCDEQTFTKFNSEKGFVNEAFAGLPSWYFIDAGAVVKHINWETDPNPFITRFISMCSTEDKTR
ncbi:hypothetical protein EPUS_05267 [Endocarpon pusillum Z07020]|uniref:Uncharacterized protein n=1 Tax=Endocarpon pusillum (strain Z07020 / HMAS-L-300199) TaxID=1263415 RepID=U1G941_ENDPU|nr:uncharacterized protein EPUS_05267 [Endocarpon pusillum Z07020]ERF68186.1 hypothetical protein EPUS_05267 [Endocarpon pusillum Z07020]